MAMQPEMRPAQLNLEHYDPRVDKIAKLADKLGRGGYGSWFEVFSVNESKLRGIHKHGIGDFAIATLNSFKSDLISLPIPDIHTIVVSQHAKQNYAYQVYIMDDLPISFPNSYVNYVFQWALEGHPIQFAGLKTEASQTIRQDFSREIELINSYRKYNLKLVPSEENPDHLKLILPKNVIFKPLLHSRKLKSI